MKLRKLLPSNWTAHRDADWTVYGEQICSNFEFIFSTSRRFLAKNKFEVEFR